MGRNLANVAFASIFLAVLTSVPHASASGPVAFRGLLSIASQAEELTVSILTEKPVRNSTVDFSFLGLSNLTVANFEQSALKYDVTLILPNSKAISIPAYFDGQNWRARFLPFESGKYSVSVKQNNSLTASGPGQTFEVAESNLSGPVRVSINDPLTLETMNGKSFYPIAVNLLDESATKMETLLGYVPILSKAKINLVRILVSQNSAAFGLEKPRSLQWFDYAAADRLERFLKALDTVGIRALLVLESNESYNNELSKGQWNRNPHSSQFGGPLRIWSDFWVSESMKNRTEAKLRYIAARFAPLNSVFGFELFDEADLTSDFSIDLVRPWHERTSRYLRSVAPYGKPITTSYRSVIGERSIDRFPTVDISQSHILGSNDFGAAVGGMQSRKSGYGKPHIIGRVAASASRSFGEVDVIGSQFHDALWAGVASGTAGTPMGAWFRQCLLERQNLSLWTSLANFVEGIEWNKENFRQSTASVGYLNRPKKLPFTDLVMANGPIVFERSPSTIPQRVRIIDGVPTGDLPLAGALQGLGLRNVLNNPVTFVVTVNRPTEFSIEVGAVSGRGGATLELFLDGRRAMRKVFADPDGNSRTEDLLQYAGNYSTLIPPGTHTIRVRNTGQDWVAVGYRFGKARRTTRPLLTTWSLIGDRTAIVWARHSERTWHNLYRLKKRTDPIPPTIIALPGLASGIWRVEQWSTRQGKVKKAFNLKVGILGVARINTPAVTHDIAIKLTRLGPLR